MIDTMLIIGTITVGVGLAMVWTPACLLWFGGVLIVAAIAMQRQKDSNKETDPAK